MSNPTKIPAQLKFKVEMDIIVSVQAQMVLEQSEVSLDEFIDWATKRRPFTLGAGNVVEYMEKRYKDKVKENGSTSS